VLRELEFAVEVEAHFRNRPARHENGCMSAAAYRTRESTRAQAPAARERREPDVRWLTPTTRPLAAFPSPHHRSPLERDGIRPIEDPHQGNAAERPEMLEERTPPLLFELDIETRTQSVALWIDGQKFRRQQRRVAIQPLWKNPRLASEPAQNCSNDTLRGKAFPGVTAISA
jgi:hypothetical protein